jgi:hypothetical protein
VSKPKKIITFFGLFVATLSIIGVSWFLAIPQVKLTFNESDKKLINPSRGFYVQFDTGHLEGINELQNEGVSLVFLAYDLIDFVDNDLSNEKLSELDLALKTAKDNGLKVIFRAAYGFSNAQDFSDPHSLDRIKGHLVQMSPILNKYKDVLLTVQAGFLGPWGEWHDSNLGDQNGKPGSQLINELVKALVDAVPQPISIALRRPSFMREIDPELIDVSRIAFHNDALLSTESDMGTYELETLTREEELNYISSLPYALANGGEMPMMGVYTEAEQAIKELALIKLTYLNLKYNKEVLDLWRNTPYQALTFFDHISNKLGYRWFIESMTLPSSFRRDQSFTIKIEMNNVGFSAITLPYKAELIISDENGILQVLPFESYDLRELSPNSTMLLKMKINSQGLPKSFTLGIRFKETSMTQIIDERTLIKLANDFRVHDGIHELANYQEDDQSLAQYHLIKSEN